MELTLHTLKTPVGSRKKSKRIGRGNSSGHGTYSTKGQKGQRARSGGSKGLKLKGFKDIVKRMPKLKGFKSHRLKPQIVNLIDLEKKFKDGETVDIKILLEKGLVKDQRQKVKVLGEGKLTKKLTVNVHNFSKSAKEAIEKAGGRIVITNPKL